jgi:hypothetical protein
MMAGTAAIAAPMRTPANRSSMGYSPLTSLNGIAKPTTAARLCCGSPWTARPLAEQWRRAPLAVSWAARAQVFAGLHVKDVYPHHDARTLGVDHTRVHFGKGMVRPVEDNRLCRRVRLGQLT